MFFEKSFGLIFLKVLSIEKMKFIFIIYIEISILDCGINNKFNKILILFGVNFFDVLNKY